MNRDVSGEYLSARIENNNSNNTVYKVDKNHNILRMMKKRQYLFLQQCARKSIICLLFGYTIVLNAQNYVWAKNIGSPNGEEGKSVAVDNLGNVYVTGYFQGTADFDPGVSTYNLSSINNSNDIFISKFDALGNLLWVKTMGSTTDDGGTSIAVDGLGNVYTTGYFVGTTDFDPGTGTFNLTSAGYWDIFVCKLDASGNFVWAKNMGSIFDDYGAFITVDNLGNIYTTGYFQLAADFDPGPGTFNLTSVGLDDIFVSKLDASGNFVWAKGIGGRNYDSGTSIAVDDSGNVYTTGYFKETADFDPGTGTYNLSTLFNSNDIFISKLDALGNFIWAKSMGKTGYDSGSSIAVDHSGNVYTTGYFSETVDFDPSAGTFNLTSAGYTDVFLSKLNASGNLVWAKRMGSTSGDGGTSIAIDGSGNVYTTGYFSETVDFDPSAGTFNLTSEGGEDIFLSKLNASGNLIWAKSMGATSSDIGFSIVIDGSDNIYSTGRFQGTVDFDPSAGISNLTSLGNYWDIFVLKMSGSTIPVELIDFTGKNTMGLNRLTWQTASEINSSHFDIERSHDGISFEKIGETKAQGKATTYQFLDNAPLTISYYRLKEISIDGIGTLSKVIEISTNSKNKFKIYPSVTTYFLTVEGDEGDNFDIINILGQTVLKGEIKTQIDVSQLPKGTYWFKTSYKVSKFVKQ